MKEKAAKNVKKKIEQISQNEEISHPCYVQT